jgi:hypothetical protein
MAASDAGSSDLTVRKAGGEHENITVRKAGGAMPDFVTLRKPGGEPLGYIISVL